jgi:hypothetical protein
VEGILQACKSRVKDGISFIERLLPGESDTKNHSTKISHKIELFQLTI